MATLTKPGMHSVGGIAGLYPDYIQIMARADAGIATLADLKGKRVSVGTRNSPIELSARAKQSGDVMQGDGHAPGASYAAARSACTPAARDAAPGTRT